MLWVDGGIIKDTDMSVIKNIFLMDETKGCFVLFIGRHISIVVVATMLLWVLGKNQKDAIRLNGCYVSSKCMTSQNSQKPKTPQLSVKDHNLQILPLPSPFFRSNAPEQRDVNPATLS